MSEHTKGPWRIETYHQGESDIFDGDDHSIINGSTGMIDDVEVARRIVACVNACEGIETHELELMIGDLSIHNQITNKLPEKMTPKAVEYRMQRDELLAALEESLKALRTANESAGGPIRDTIWYSETETLFDFMDAAISNVKGGES